MYKYEIMIVVDGELSNVDARMSILNLLALFENQFRYSENVIYSDTLAYAIKKKKIGHRFILNFEMNDPERIKEFNRLALLNKSVLRHLVINESKDRSFKARNNPKKIRDFEIKQEKMRQYLENKKNFQNISNAS